MGHGESLDHHCSEAALGGGTAGRVGGEGNDPAGQAIVVVRDGQAVRGQQLRQQPDGRPDRRPATCCRFEQDEALAFVARRQDAERRGPVQRRQPLVRDRAVERDAAADPERAGSEHQRLALGTVASEVEMDAWERLSGDCDGAQKRTVVLDRHERADGEKGRVTGELECRDVRTKQAGVDAERQPGEPRDIDLAGDDPLQERAAGGDAVRTVERLAGEPAVEAATWTAVAGVGQGDELAAEDRDDGRDAESPGEAGRDVPRLVGPEAMEQVERRGAVAGFDDPCGAPQEREAARAGDVAAADGVDARPANLVGADHGRVAEGEDLDIVLVGDGADKVEQCWDAPIVVSGAKPRRDQRETHPATPIGER